MTFSTNNFVNPSVLSIFVARTPGGPTTDQLVICTGIAEIVFEAINDNQIFRDHLQFLVPGEDSQPLQLNGPVFDVIASASLAGVGAISSDTALYAVDSVDTFLSNPERDTQNHVLLDIAVAIEGGHVQQVSLSDIAYYVAIQVGPSGTQ